MAPLKDQPTILVMGSLIPSDVTQELRDVLKNLATTVLQTLAGQGAKTRFLEAAGCALSPEQLLRDCQGLLVLGGADADPACYGQSALADTIYGVNPAVDMFELSVMAHAKDKGLPILGICRGMQLINILQWGDLIQEIGHPTLHNGIADNSIMVSHEVTIVENTHLARIYQKPTLQVRSGHHQAVDRLGQGLIVSARAEDGMIEAIEGEGPHMILGVQWHPEDALADPEDRLLLIQALLRAAQATQAPDRRAS